MAQVNVNIDELKKMAAIIAAEQIKMQNGNNGTRQASPKLPQQLPQRLHSQPPPQQKFVAKVVNSDSTSDVANIIPTKSTGDANDSQQVDNQITGSGDDNMLGIFGFSIPKQTLYFLIILVAIAVAIWYMSRDNKSGKKRKRHDEE